jgi:hypothetical protein
MSDFQETRSAWRRLIINGRMLIAEWLLGKAMDFADTRSEDGRLLVLLVGKYMGHVISSRSNKPPEGF